MTLVDYKCNRDPGLKEIHMPPSSFQSSWAFICLQVSRCMGAASGTLARLQLISFNFDDDCFENGCRDFFLKQIEN